MGSDQAYCCLASHGSGVRVCVIPGWELDFEVWGKSNCGEGEAVFSGCVKHSQGVSI